MLDKDQLTAVQFPRMGELSWDEEFPGYDRDRVRRLSRPLFLSDVTLKKFRFEAIEGGSVNVTFNVIFATPTRPRPGTVRADPERRRNHADAAEEASAELKTARASRAREAAANASPGLSGPGGNRDSFPTRAAMNTTLQIPLLLGVSSSQIHAIGHDADTNTLAIRFTRGYGRDQRQARCTTTATSTGPRSTHSATPSRRASTSGSTSSRSRTSTPHEGRGRARRRDGLSSPSTTTKAFP